MSSDTVVLTPAQDEAIAAQIARYADPDCPCEGLQSHRIYPATEWGSSSPDGAVAVDFVYVRDDGGETGLEVTIFSVDGTITDSQDFG